MIEYHPPILDCLVDYLVPAIIKATIYHHVCTNLLRGTVSAYCDLFLSRLNEDTSS